MSLKMKSALNFEKTVPTKVLKPNPKYLVAYFSDDQDFNDKLNWIFGDEVLAEVNDYTSELMRDTFVNASLKIFCCI